MKRKQLMILGLVFFTALMGCKNTATIEEITGCWEGNVLFFNQSHTKYLQLELNERNEYLLKAVDTGKNFISSGEYALENGKISFTPINVRDTNQISMLMDLNNRPVKVLNRNETQGLQIKMNDVWHFLEKTN